eukprot:403351100
MFKKRDKNQNQLKRTVEDRVYNDQEDQKNSNNHSKRQKLEDDLDQINCQDHIHEESGCNHNHDNNQIEQKQSQSKSISKVSHNSGANGKPKVLSTSTKTQQGYRQSFIHQEVNDLNFKPLKEQLQNKEQDGATRSLDIDTEYSLDAIALARKNIEITQGIMDGKLKQGIYRGEAGYMNQFNLSETDLKHKQFTGTLGPVRAPTFIRNTTRVDYNPELCKDFFETGRCGFGDSCIFIHDRSDYKPGWLLDQEFEKEQKRKQKQMLGQDVSDDEENYEILSENSQGDVDEEGLPIKCRICDQFFRSPVVTQCNHYFCEKCALDHYSKTSDCFICDKPTNGIFNEAPKLLKKSNQLIKKTQFQNESDNEDGEKDNENSDEDKIKRGSDNDSDEDNTTVTQLKTRRPVNNDDSDDEDGGVLSKEDREVFNQYKKKFVDIDKKKYQSQTGWFIP